MIPDIREVESAMNHRFKERLQRGETLLGTIISLPSLEVAEIMANAGFDWLFVDMEHSTLGFEMTQHILQAVDSKTTCVVRVPSPHEAWFKKCLDMGAGGIMVPQVNSAEQAQSVVKACRYPPEGERSVGIARAHGYGMAFGEYMEQANAELAVILQVEHVDSVSNIDTIVQVPGIDALFVGPYDLSASLGKTGKVDDPEVRDAISRVRENALAARVPLGIFGANPDSVKEHIESGYRLVAVGMDSLLLGQAADALISSFPRD